MKRLALLIGNTNNLPGIHKDLEDFESFLLSNIGGAWDANSEICKAYNVSYSNLKKNLERIKCAKMDYFIFYYSGHGSLDRSFASTVLELNGDEDSIDEFELAALAPRQLNIYDCCRSVPQTAQKSILMNRVQFSMESCRTRIRDLYNTRIMESYEQQINLYACAQGECANATGEGSIYTQNLIKGAKNNSNSNVLVLDAHEAAVRPTAEKASLLGEEQHPDCTVYPINLHIPRNKQLILAIKSSYLYG